MEKSNKAVKSVTFPAIYALVNDDGIAEDDENNLCIGNKDDVEGMLDDMLYGVAKNLRFVKLRIEAA
jgi:hypothetical protein